MDVSEGQFRAIAGGQIEDAEIKAKVKEEVCAQGQTVVDYSRGILTLPTSVTLIEGRCGFT